MRLTPELAQPIVDRAMAILQRNVNIMDANGIIVGSGDRTRVGNFHQGAAAVLRSGRRVEIQPEDVPNWGGVRMGVNLALRLDGQIAGVVGITGLPDEVRPFGELIREMVQLMLIQARTAELERATALAREACLRDLLTGTGDLPERLVHEATLMGLDRESAYTVLLCEPAPAAEPGDYAWVETVGSRAGQAARDAGVKPFLVTGPWEGRLVMLAGGAPADVLTPLRAALAPACAVAAGIGVQGMGGLRRSYRTAVLTLEASRNLYGAGAFTADGLHLETMLATVAPEEARAFVRRVAGGLPSGETRAGRLLRETLQGYLQAGLSLTAAAEGLGIHRHTLMYRLDQIAGATGQDPRTWDGAARLYLAFLLERLFRQDGQNGT